MAIPCTVLCLLAISLDFKPSPDIQKCAYCAQMRALSLNCELKPWACAEWDPDSLIYCLSRDERPWGRDALKRSTRCISHANLLNQSQLITEDVLQTLAQVPAPSQQKYCTFEAAQECQCPDCPVESDEGKPWVEAEEPKDEPPVGLATELENIALMLDKMIVEEQRGPGKAATRKNTRRTLPPKLVAASAPLRPLPKASKDGPAHMRIIPLPMDLFYSGASSTSLEGNAFWPIHFSLALILGTIFPYFL